MATPVTDGMNAGVVAAIINAQGTQIDNVEQALPDKADLENGLLPVAQLPEVPEEKLPDTYYNGVQFERVLVDGLLTIQLKQSFIDSISGGSTPVDPDAASPAGSLTGRNYKFVQDTWPNDLELRTNGGTAAPYVSGTNIAVGDGAVSANYYESRVKSVSGSHKASAWVGNTAIAAASSGGGVVERTIRVNFQSEYSSNPTTSGVTWNNLKPTNAQLQQASGYSSPNFITDTGGATTISIINTSAFAGANAAVATPTPTESIYPSEIVNSGWEFTGLGNEYSIKLQGLKTDKVYQARLAGLSINNPTDTIIFKSSSVSGSVVSYNNFGTSSDNELTSNIFVLLSNLTPNSNGELTLTMSGSVSGFTKFLTILHLQETSAAV